LPFENWSPILSLALGGKGVSGSPVNGPNTSRVVGPEEKGMAERDVGELLKEANQHLDQLNAQIEISPAATGAIVDRLRATLDALGDSLGECRQAVPYSSMHPVRGADGQMRWCCNHNPEHCG
jgi:hypothetical protein